MTNDIRDQDSFLIYWPKIKDLGIPVPRTDMVMVTDKEFNISFEGVPNSLTDKVHKVITEKFTLPVFIRTDQSSGKHDWGNSCFYDGSKPLYHNLGGVIEFNHTADIMGLPFKAIIIREYIPMASGFTAFYGNMPVNPERRYFIKDGDILCHHHYWIEEAIESSRKPSVENWKEIARELNTESIEEISLLSGYARKVASVIDGFWSVDFCKSKAGDWYLIDMATGEHSWHPEKCPNSKLSPKRSYLPSNEATP